MEKICKKKKIDSLYMVSTRVRIAVFFFLNLRILEHPPFFSFDFRIPDTAESAVRNSILQTIRKTKRKIAGTDETLEPKRNKTKTFVDKEETMLSITNK